MLHIQLKDVKIFSFHGLYPEEQILGGDFLVNLEVKIDPQKLDIDRIDKTVNYENLFAILSERMSQPSKLLETIVMDISATIFNSYPIVKEIKLDIQKSHPPIKKLKGHVSVGIQIDRSSFFTLVNKVTDGV